MPKLKTTTLPNGEILDFETYTVVTVVSSIVGIDLTKKVSNGSYSTRVGASGKTHAGSGAVDFTNLTDAECDKVVRAWRMVTAGRGTAWKRPKSNKWGLHVHALLVTAESDPSLINQYKAYVAGGDGLVGDAPDNGPRDYVNTTGQLSGNIDYNLIDQTGGGESVLTQAITLQSVYAKATDPAFLRRFAIFLVGAILIITALVRLSSLPLDIDIAGMAKKG